jgi:hypothetical protein
MIIKGFGPMMVSDAELPHFVANATEYPPQKTKTANVRLLKSRGKIFGDRHLSIPRPAHPQRSTSNQSRRDPVARDTSAFQFLPQLAGESINAFYLPPASSQSLSRRRPCGGGASARRAVFDLVRRNADSELKCNARGFIHPEFNEIPLPGDRAPVACPCSTGIPQAPVLLE